MTKAAVFTGIDQPLEIVEDIVVDQPKAGEVRLTMGASGVCHSDLSVQNGTLMLAPGTILGHEGAGVIESVGEGVTHVKAGDKVVVSWVPQCGECFFCVRDQGYLCEQANNAIGAGIQLDGTTRAARADGTPLFQMSAVGTFAETAILPGISVVKIDDDVDVRIAALIGCGVLTGVGAAINTADIKKGDTVAVVGCGGVGLNVIQGAKIAGASRIIAIDMVASKLDLAREFGATETINAGETDAVSAVMAATEQRGADVAFEVIGLKATIDQVIGMTRRGGEVVLVGVPRMDVMVEIPGFFGLVLADKKIKGCWYGSSNVQKDVPKLIELYKSGKLKLDELISREIKVDEVNEAFQAMKDGEVARSVIVY